ncbi:MAG: hypothetical protein ACJ71Z_00615 [Aeromicrobium sp.]
MTQQPDDATPRVVKKVVKKTVVRPVAPAAARSAASAPARLTTPARVQATRAATPVAAASAPALPPVRRPTPTPRPAAPTQAAGAPAARPGRRLPSLPSLPKPNVRGRASDLGHGIGDAVSDAVTAVRHRIVDAWEWLISLRLPHLSPPKGAAITGVLVGVMCVAMGWGFYELFSRLLGTQAGGGWGFLAFVFLSFVAFIVGELLLSGFGVPHARVVSILSVLLVLLIVLVFFIKLAAGVWAWLLIPTLFALALVASNAIIDVATKEENPQRLPWEPTDQSQVKTD